MLDIVIKGAEIFDGLNNKAFNGDIGIKDGEIKKIGIVEQFATKEINARGMVACPGFIDIHTHSDFTILMNPKAENRVAQGITTDVVGNCGSSAAPITDKNQSDITSDPIFSEELELDWGSFDEYLNKLEDRGSSLNIVPLVGHGTLRSSVMGFDRRHPTEEELKKMKQLLEQAAREGYFGMSMGLIYPPSSYAKAEELIDLARILKEQGGVCASHIRGEGDTLIPAVGELIKIGEEAGIPVQLSHHKAAGRKNWGKTKETSKMIHKARDNGINITSDRYPYTASSTGLTSLLPDWLHEGGFDSLLTRLRNPGVQDKIKDEIISTSENWENPVRTVGWDRIIISQVTKEANKWMEGKRVRAIAEEKNEDKFTTVFNLLINEGAEVSIISYSQCEEDGVRVLKDPTTMIGSDGRVLSDGGILGSGKPHPRAYGTFPKVLRKYVREEKELSLQEAIYKMTGMPSQKLGLKRRGVLKEGYAADLVVFDPNKICDKANYDNPRQKPKGIALVLVNGKIVVEKGEHTGRMPGIVLRKTVS